MILKLLTNFVDREPLPSKSTLAMTKGKEMAQSDLHQTFSSKAIPKPLDGFGDFAAEVDEKEDALPTFAGLEEHEESKVTGQPSDAKQDIKKLIGEIKEDSTADEMSISEQEKSEDFKMDFVTKNQERSGEAMRRKFLSKLTQEKVWLTPSEKPKAHQTCIIFDWDDTLL